jgi:hypothetical protein
MASIPDAISPTATIFLDIDGVLMWDMQNPGVGDMIEKKLAELFGPAKDHSMDSYTNLQWKTAASHFFTVGAVANLHKLIEKVSKVTKVNIVLHSAWRERVSVKDLREQMFAIHAFAKLIIDKTPDPSWIRHEKGKDKLSEECLKKHGFKLRDYKGVAIDFWLRENTESLNVKSFVILDDYEGDEMPDRFPHNFVHVKKMLSEADINKAYEILTKPFLAPAEASKSVASRSDEHKA